ncbi:MAG: hypothetical protein ACP5E3_06870 [Bacteroidales bacterium]
MKKRIFIIAIFLISIAGQAKAQDYINAVGLRGGLAQGITFKHFLSNQDAAEGILAVRWGGFYVTGLYERHMPAFDTDGLYFFYGGGAHIGFWDSANNIWFDEAGSYTVFGVDGILGLEYVFYQIPFNISLDWKPAFNLIGVTNFWGSDLAISLRFMF